MSLSAAPRTPGKGKDPPVHLVDLAQYSWFVDKESTPSAGEWSTLHNRAGPGPPPRSRRDDVFVDIFKLQGSLCALWLNELTAARQICYRRTCELHKTRDSKILLIHLRTASDPTIEEIDTFQADLTRPRTIQCIRLSPRYSRVEELVANAQHPLVLSISLSLMAGDTVIQRQPVLPEQQESSSSGFARGRVDGHATDLQAFGQVK
ncbi:hypothetical protein NUW54_g9378 [Trametes sanguinea]|uniref:Uncharacterized protein n=1 Tax=Trametes sanguinea TaxID=158606 RepID=A0ACC1P6G7_9APHY|nr:hypothetical protein NUW54_g9378 [Trametes sanguinea]